MSLEEGKREKGGKKEIVQVTVGFVALFFVLMGYFVFYAATHKEELLNNSYNSRQQLFGEQNRRGAIYARGGEILAETVCDKSGNEIRRYPYDEMFAHAVGYLEKGRSGIEAQANYYLLRSDIPAVDKVKEEIGGKKNPGNNVYTTLSVPLQEAAFHALGIYRGAVVALDPKTGEILAMVSKPDFDPNRISELWEEIIEDDESGTLVNRATQGLYPPGSTFKLVTTLEYIRENPESYSSYRYTCSGSIEGENSRISCYHGSRHGTVDLRRSFSESCNSSYANIGKQLDREAFAETLDGLLFNQPLPLRFAYNQSSLEVGPDTSEDEMMQAAIGQGKTQITPLHLAMLTAAAANGGVLMKPYLLDRVETAEGGTVKRFAPEEYKRLMSEEEAAILSDYMKEVVESGTGTKLSGLSYTAAGKTGSAEYNRQKGESHAWFTGFAPAEDPQLVVTVIIEGAGSGGDYAVPVARRVFDAYLDK